MTRPPRGNLLFVLLAGWSTAGGAQEARPVVVEPTELTRRADLVGKLVSVDDRVARFQLHPDVGIDEIFLRRCPEVAFALPQHLRYSKTPNAVSARIEGILRKDAGRYRCEVTTVELFPSDVDRLTRAVALLPRSDSENRARWAAWAEKRARAFQDDALLKRALEIEAESIRTESARSVTDPAEHLLALADRARSRRIPEPEPSALAHQGFRLALASASRADEAEKIVGRIEAFFPGVDRPIAADPDLEKWLAPYAKSPAEGYRLAPSPARAQLDHRLWADTLQHALEKRGKEDPRSLLTLADDAARRLPDRPDLATSLLERGVGVESKNIGALRLSEVENLAKLYRVRLRQPEKGQALLRSWLEDQKLRLSPGDVEGRLALAEQFESLLQDRESAVALLRDAWRLDPQSREVGEAFLRRRFRKVDGQWVERPGNSAEPAKSEAVVEEAEKSAGPGSEPPTAPSSPVAARDASLLNATPDQVIARMSGKPDRRVRIATASGVAEQWIYAQPRQYQYINIAQRVGDTRPRVISYYTLPRRAGDGRAEP